MSKSFFVQRKFDSLFAPPPPPKYSTLKKCRIPHEFFVEVLTLMVITGLKYPVSKNVTFAKWILEVICVWCTWQKMSVPSKLVVVLKILLFAYFVSLALFIFQIFLYVF